MFGEEVGADWRNLGNAKTNFRFVRLQTDQDRLNKQIPPIPTARESWALLVDLDAQECENALFNQNRSAWRLRDRMNMKPVSKKHGGLAKETAGYAFVPLEALLTATRGPGGDVEFKLGPVNLPLRFGGKTVDAARAIANVLHPPVETDREVGKLAQAVAGLTVGGVPTGRATGLDEFGRLTGHLGSGNEPHPRERAPPEVIRADLEYALHKRSVLQALVAHGNAQPVQTPHMRTDIEHNLPAAIADEARAIQNLQGEIERRRALGAWPY